MGGGGGCRGAYFAIDSETGGDHIAAVPISLLQWLAHRLSVSTGTVQVVYLYCNWHGIYVDVRERITSGNVVTHGTYVLAVDRIFRANVGCGMVKWAEQLLPGQPEQRLKVRQTGSEVRPPYMIFAH